jgi:hypothetical protein
MLYLLQRRAIDGIEMERVFLASAGPVEDAPRNVDAPAPGRPGHPGVAPS